MKLYFRYVGMLFKSQMQYKASFLFMVLGQFLTSFTAFLGVFFLFDRFHSVSGFSFSEVLICFAVVLMAFSTAECFVRGFDAFPRLIRSGNLDRIWRDIRDSAPAGPSAPGSRAFPPPPGAPAPGSWH